jgi:hypothetical protein
MKFLRLVLLVALFCPAPPPAAAAPPKKPTKPSVEQMHKQLNKLLNDLLAMQRSNAKNPDPTSRKRVAASIGRALIRVRAALAGKAEPMDGRSFAALVRELRKQRDGAPRLAALRARIKGQLLSSEQAVRVARLFGAEAHRIGAAALLWWHLSDPRASARLTRAVGSKAAQAKLQQKLKFKE